MQRFGYRSDPSRDESATYGAILLKTDETLEGEFRRLLPASGCVLHHTRIESDAEVTPQTLAAMEERIPGSVGLLPPSARFEAIAYCCTSGATMIGPRRVAELVRTVFPSVRVTDPLTAAMARLRAANARRIALLTPYLPSVTEAMVDAFTAEGFEIAVSGSFYEERESAVVRIAQESVLAAVCELTSQCSVEAAFVSCTNLPTVDILDEARMRTGVDVISSNSALAWHLTEPGR
jgi:maleate isomerase